MSHIRVTAGWICALISLGSCVADGAIGIAPIADQYVPSGKTLVVPLPATDPAGPARSYTVTIGSATTQGMPTSTAGIMGTIRTGDPHLILGVSYTDSNSILQSGTMEFQLLREFAPLTTQIIAGLAQGGFYNPAAGSGGVNYLEFFRVAPGYFIQGGDPNNDGSGGPGFSFENEFSSALIFSGTAGQLAMSNSGYGVSGSQVVTTSGTTTVVTDARSGTNGSQFFITLSNGGRAAFDYGYSIFGQMLRGFDTLNGIGGTSIQDNGDGEVSSPINPVNITGVAVTQNDTDAVLLLSATGVCDAVVVVTASSGNSTSTQAFTAHAVADNVNDPPFLQPVPDVTTPNSQVKVALQGTDLQLDFLRYGFDRLLPVLDSSLNTGTSPLLSIPLYSNTDNTIEATVDHWAAVDSPHGFERRVFHAGAEDQRLRGELIPIPAGRYGTLVLKPHVMADFTSGNPKAKPGSFAASINWGDGTFVSGSNVAIVRDPGDASGRRFDLIAGHTYIAAGEYPVIVNIADNGGSRVVLSGTANIGPASIGIFGRDFYNDGGSVKNEVIATFKDGGAPVSSGSYSATIDWGDGLVSPGTIKKTPYSSFQVIGSHGYKSSGTFTVSASVLGSGTNMASEWSAAHVTGETAPQVFPPFPQAHLAQAWFSITTGSNPDVSGTSFLIDVSASVTIVNSGNRPSLSGSFAAYADSSGTLTALTAVGQSSFAIPPLQPGQMVTFYFNRTTPMDSRLYLPVGFDPTGQYLIGVVTYSDPVGDYDGSQKVISLGQF